MGKRTPVPKLAAEVTIDVTSVPRDPSRPPDRLRWEARAIYLTHPDGVTVDELAKDPRFVDAVSVHQMRVWCSEDGWVEDRKSVLAKFGDKLASELQKKLWSKLMNLRLGQLQTVEDLLADLVAKVKSTEAKSAEGAAKAVLDLLKYQVDLSQNVAKELSPRAGGGQIEPRSGATDEEVTEIATMVLLRRRRRLLAAAPPAAVPPSAAEDDPLPLSLLAGEDGCSR